MTLTRQVGRTTRAIFLAVAGVVLLNALAFAYVYLAVSPTTSRYTAGGREIRLAHLAMVDQETG
ncbi:MAG: hypothetical protein ACXVFV_01070, partial [Mycobacteriales bacterium]